MCMYVRVYVCMYVCMNACMCMYGIPVSDSGREVWKRGARSMMLTERPSPDITYIYTDLQ